MKFRIKHRITERIIRRFLLLPKVLLDTNDYKEYHIFEYVYVKQKKRYFKKMFNGYWIDVQFVTEKEYLEYKNRKKQLS